MTFEEWLEEYRPVKNHLDSNASFDGCMFETFGPELEHVKAVDAAGHNNVWTYVTGDADTIINGFHYVNRMGYFITEKRHRDGDIIEIDLED